VNIYNNHIHDYANWDNTSNLYHHDGSHVYDAITTYANLSIYNNLFDGNIGENITAHVFVGGSIVTNMRVFNNVMTASNQPAGGSGFLVLLFSGTSDAAVYNNTFRCAAPGSGPGAVNLYTGSVTMQNNVMVNCGTFVIAASGSLAASGLNNNVYASASGGLLWKYGANFYSTLAGWRGATGQDASAVYTSGSAGLDSTFHPLTGSIVIGARTNLMSLGITALNSDKAGVARPASGAWDAGAYVFISNRPAPPTGLQVR
jgi:hypothetical protein